MIRFRRDHMEHLRKGYLGEHEHDRLHLEERLRLLKQGELLVLQTVAHNVPTELSAATELYVAKQWLEWDEVAEQLRLSRNASRELRERIWREASEQLFVAVEQIAAALLSDDKK